ncbi:hypothetical protein GF412_04055 [Candidatus Micrarchaeota archaeon]|nr:hypothetical protein [Candidatus Micrarchaeota archaeon]MBD3418123.1 hypothetical protein [Candidatus Micrarchaeota archaeon]
MKRFLLAALLLFSLSYSLEYSTLEIRVIDQNANPVEGVHFFLKCKMTFSSPERYLCTSGMNGTCKSGCMDCAAGETAFVTAQYGNDTFEQEITAWTGSDQESCKSFHPPSNPLGTFIIEVEEIEEEESEQEGNQTAQGGIPENVNIETKDYHFSSTEYEYTSYLEGEEETASEEECLPAFALLGLLFCAFAFSSRE